MRRESESTGPLLVATAAVTAALPILYILSAGPVHWLWSSGYVSGDEGSFVWAIYAPMRWACQTCEPFCNFIEWYQSFFVAEGWQ